MWKDHYRSALIFIHAAVVGTMLSITNTSAQVYDKSTPPPRPDWVDADGKVNIDKAPKEVPVAGPDGKHIRDASGNEKKVPTYFGVLPPPPLRADLAPKRAKPR
jgi:hypothetical protein